MASIETRTRAHEAAAGPDQSHPAPDRAGGRAPRPGTVKDQPVAETLRLYAGDWACFQAYCAVAGTGLPASPELVAAFLTVPGVGRAALARRLAAIDHQHRQRGLPAPGLDAGVRTALRQARRTAPRQTRAAPPTPAALARMAGACRGDLAGQRDRALLLLLASGLGRSAVVALQAEQLRFSEAGLAVIVGTGEDGPRTREVPRAALPAGCAVRALEDWLRASATRYGPVFRKVNRWGQLSTPPSAPTRSDSSWPGAPSGWRRANGPDGAPLDGTDAAGSRGADDLAGRAYRSRVRGCACVAGADGGRTPK